MYAIPTKLARFLQIPSSRIATPHTGLSQYYHPGPPIPHPVNMQVQKDRSSFLTGFLSACRRAIVYMQVRSLDPVGLITKVSFSLCFHLNCLLSLPSAHSPHTSKSWPSYRTVSSRTAPCRFSATNNPSPWLLLLLPQRRTLG